MLVIPLLREPIGLTPVRTGALAADELSLLAFAWIVDGPVPNQQRPDSEPLPLPTETLCGYMSKGCVVSVGLRTGPIWVLMISVLVAAVDADAVVAELNHPHTEGRHPANVQWIEPAKRRTPLQRRAHHYLHTTRIGRRLRP